MQLTKSSFLRKAATLTSLAAALCVAPLYANVVRVSEAEGKKHAIQKTEPQYPALARQMNVRGLAVVDMFVDADGTVEKVEVVSGNPVLASAASNAAKNWKFQPFMADGSPSKVVVRLGFNFGL